MSRKGPATKRKVIPDPKFHDKLVSKLVTKLMEKGKKSLAEQVVYGAFDILQEKANDEPLKVFKQALDNLKPVLEVRSRRVGGATYQVPMEVRPDRRVSLGLRWLVAYSRSRGEKTMRERLAMEILDALNNRGASIKKKEDVHKMAESNRAFAHYRW
ncbi:MAG: 30S ribosomal protein S7 [Deltaproteobacteria bacterium]|nr:30S ribosomal protein S7 [Deltaproteobacteria bacterium]